MNPRRLVSIRREVAGIDQVEYREAWLSLAGEIRGTGSHAWHFNGASEPTLFLEFIEFRDDPRHQPSIATKLADLERFGRGTVEEWLEA